MDDKVVSSFTPPVLFIVFNRLDTAREVMSAIAAARPDRLYIAADGPRSHRPDEAARTAEVRAAILQMINWPCHVQTLFQDDNLGCRRGVITAIDWFFEHEAEGIILEDDVIPSPQFFTFCHGMLEQYRNDPRVMMVSGTNQLGAGITSSRYFFSSLGSIWGWASWRRAWSRYDETMSAWNPTMAATLERRHGKPTGRYLRHIFDFHLRNNVDTWDTQWLYTVQASEGLAVMSEANLIRNIGIVGTHSSIETTNHNLAHGVIDGPLVLKDEAMVDDADYRARMVRDVYAPTMRISRASQLARAFGIHGALKIGYQWLWRLKKLKGG